eukprot:286764-Pelagomonas_calceolata.AAC.3
MDQSILIACIFVSHGRPKSLSKKELHASNAGNLWSLRRVRLLTDLVAPTGVRTSQQEAGQSRIWNSKQQTGTQEWHWHFKYLRVEGNDQKC